MREIIAVILIVCLILTFNYFEESIMNNAFEELTLSCEIVNSEINNFNTAYDLAVLAKDNWEKNKLILYKFIPHDDIKEIDIHFVNLITYIEFNNIAYAKLEINSICELAKDIPNNYYFLLENIL